MVIFIRLLPIQDIREECKKYILVTLLKKYRIFFYDDCDEGYMDKGIDGFIIQTDIDDPLPEELIDAKVGEIAVFLPSAFKP